MMFKKGTFTRKNYWRYGNERRLNLLVDVYQASESRWMPGKVMSEYTTVQGSVDKVVVQLFANNGSESMAESNGFPEL